MDVDDGFMLVVLSIIIFVSGFMALSVIRIYIRSDQGYPTKSERQKKQEEFFKTLSEGRKRSLISTYEDVVNYYRGIFANISDNNSQKYALSRLLRIYLVKLSNEGLKNGDGGFAQEDILEWKNMITQFIEENETVSPFEEIPLAERNILYDIRKHFETNDIEMLERKLHELSGSIRARENTLNRIRLINKWTLPVSIVGVVLTVVFGVMAFILSQPAILNN